MKAKAHRLVAVVVVLAVLCSMMIPVFATDADSGIDPQASYYINSVYAYVTGGSRSITVNFSITATGQMTSLGAQRIEIYDYSNTLVKTYYGTTTEGMLASNRYSYSGSVTYGDARTGAKYYAVVTLKASNSSGGDSDTYTTGYATAK